MLYDTTTTDPTASTTTTTTPTTTTLQQQIDASDAANPNAAGANGSLFTYGGGNPYAPPISSQAPSPFITIPGHQYTPDEYNAFISGDPGLQALQASTTGAESSFAANMRKAIQQAVLNSGYGADAASPYLDAGMADQAASNPYSTAALSASAHANNLRAIQNALAARGAYDSGELGYGVGNESQRYNQEGLQNRGKVLDYINQLLGQQAGLTASDQAALANELGAATQRQYTLHPGNAAVTANYDSNTQTYVDSYGNHYDVNGNILTQGPPPAAPSNAGPTVTPPTVAPPPVMTQNQAIQSAGLYDLPPLPSFGTTIGYNDSSVGQTPSSKFLNLPV